MERRCSTCTDGTVGHRKGGGGGGGGGGGWGEML